MILCLFAMGLDIVISPLLSQNPVLFAVGLDNMSPSLLPKDLVSLLWDWTKRKCVVGDDM